MSSIIRHLPIKHAPVPHTEPQVQAPSEPNHNPSNQPEPALADVHIAYFKKLLLKLKEYVNNHKELRE